MAAGDMLFFHSYKSPGLVVDVVQDIRAINDSAMRASPRRTGMIILGGGATQQCCLLPGVANGRSGVFWHLIATTHGRRTSHAL